MEQTKLMSTAKKLGVFFKVMQRIVGIAVIVVICVLTALTVASILGMGVLLSRRKTV